jgi:hypothetical protein
MPCLLTQGRPSSRPSSYCGCSEIAIDRPTHGVYEFLDGKTGPAIYSKSLLVTLDGVSPCNGTSGLGSCGIMIIAGLSAEARAMEVDAGTGIATKPLVRRGLSGDSERTRCRDGLGGKGRGG